MKAFKQIVRVFAKIVAGIAVLVFLFAPVTTWLGWEAMGIAIIVGLASAVAYGWADDEPDQDPENSN
jgi:hypothetical protein